MKILMLTQLFQPEPNHLKGVGFAIEMVQRGHSVEVLTGFPNYPNGQIYSGYKQQWSMREIIQSITVIRVPIYPDHSNSVLKRIANYLSFSLFACIPGLYLIEKPDVVHVYQGPATLAFPAMIFKFLLRIPYVLDVQDIWPESVQGSGMLNIPGVNKLIHAWCDLSYRLATKIVVLSPGYKSEIIRRGIPADKISVIYNWTDEKSGLPNSASTDKFQLKGHFNIIYAGNIGSLQALDSVITAANQIQSEFPLFQMVFVGDGLELANLKNRVKRENILNVKFIPRQPIESIGAILQFADALLIHLRDEPLSRIGIPQKTQAYMAAGKPIIMAMNGDAAELIRQAEAGIVCDQENPFSIAAALRQIMNMDLKDRETLGKNGLRFYREKLSFSVGTKLMEEVLLSASEIR